MINNTLKLCSLAKNDTICYLHGIKNHYMLDYAIKSGAFNQYWQLHCTKVHVTQGNTINQIVGNFDTDPIQLQIELVWVSENNCTIEKIQYAIQQLEKRIESSFKKTIRLMNRGLDGYLELFNRPANLDWTTISTVEKGYSVTLKADGVHRILTNDSHGKCGND